MQIRKLVTRWCQHPASPPISLEISWEWRKGELDPFGWMGQEEASNSELTLIAHSWSRDESSWSSLSPTHARRAAWRLCWGHAPIPSIRPFRLTHPEQHHTLGKPMNIATGKLPLRWSKAPKKQVSHGSTQASTASSRTQQTQSPSA